MTDDERPPLEEGDWELTAEPVELLEELGRLSRKAIQRCP